MTLYTTFIKHAEKVTKSSPESRPILKGVCHFVDGSVAVTDTHRLHLLENGFHTDAEVVIEPKTGIKLEGNYPDIYRLILDDDNAKITFLLDVKTTLAAVKAMHTGQKTINGQGKYATVNIEQDDKNNACLQVDYELLPFQARYTIGPMDGKGFKTTCLQLKYLQDALELFKDSGTTTVILRWYDAQRPITIKSDDVTALILPIRKY